MSDVIKKSIDAGVEGAPLQEVSARLLLVAVVCHPDNSMEARNSWNRALQAAEDFHVTVVCAPDTDVTELRRRTPRHLFGRLEFLAVSAGTFADYCLQHEFLFYLGYRIWHTRVFHIAQRLHSESPFSITHMVSVCGFREPGYVWQLDCPFIWGPIGGTSNFPLKYLGIVDIFGGLFEIARNAVNSAQLYFSSRIRRAATAAAVVIAANRSTQNDIEKGTGSHALLELEAGIDYEVGTAKALTLTDRPLRILWVGRLRPWKGLPLLLHALAKLPESQEYELHIVGDGACKAKWMHLAKRLGVDKCLKWFPKPPYRESLHHYEWADVFAFTSLRDTSGTGLLESLAAGVPIIGMDHQGAADMITERCGIRIPVSDPQQSIAALATALLDLATDRRRLHQLSHGAVERARFYTWSDREPLIRKCYAAAIRSGASVTAPTEPTVVQELYS